MKPLGVFLLCVVFAAGCVTPPVGMGPELNRLIEEQKKEAPQPPSPAEVLPSQVNEKNYRDMLKQLEGEIAHDERN